nr:premnaspirodiene oxygenase-like [Aegilops tauschii subsp. strangulata]
MEDDASYFMLVLALVPLVYIIRFYYLASSRCHNRGLRLPPGPWQLPVIGSLHHLFGALPHRALRDLSRRHGPLMLLMFGTNRPVIVVSTAKAAKEMMKTHDTTFCARPLTSALKAISKHGLGIVFAPYGDHWRQMRKICFLELLSAKRIATFSSIRGEETDRFIRSIVATLEPVVNLSELLAAYLTDTTVHMIMGGQFTEQETLLRHVDEAVGIVSGVALPDLFPSSRLARALSTTLRSAEVFREAFLALMGHAIDDHLESRRSASSSEQVDQEDIIDVLLRVQGEGNLEPPLTMNNIKAVVFVSCMIRMSIQFLHQELLEMHDWISPPPLATLPQAFGRLTLGPPPPFLSSSPFLAANSGRTRAKSVHCRRHQGFLRLLARGVLRGPDLAGRDVALGAGRGSTTSLLSGPATVAWRRCDLWHGGGVGQRVVMAAAASWRRIRIRL